MAPASDVHRVIALLFKRIIFDRTNWISFCEFRQDIEGVLIELF